MSTPKKYISAVSILAGILVIALAIISIDRYVLSGSRNTLHTGIQIPTSVSANLGFPIYYPSQSKLPNGYALNTHSFKRPIKNGVTYTVGYDNGKEIVFSLQSKPSSSSMQNFEASYIPLRNNYQTPVGQAELGAYDLKGNTETLVSLPVKNSNTWIIITAPYNTNQNKLKQVLNSLEKY
jgi:hypothetical protein